MPKYQFKVGDKVRVRDLADLKQEYGMDESGTILSPIRLLPGILELCGKVRSIHSVAATTGGVVCVQLESGSYTYPASVISLVESAPEKKPEPKEEPDYCRSSRRLDALEKKLKELQGACPFEVWEDKTKPKERKPILPRVLKTTGFIGKEAISTVENYTQLLHLEKAGWKEGTSVLNWHHWSGGKCPVPPDTRVVVYLRDGGMVGDKASFFVWKCSADHTEAGMLPSEEIIAYAVIQPPKL